MIRSPLRPLCAPALAVAALLLASPVAAAPYCPPGAPIQWLADACMAELETDDTVVASNCVAVAYDQPAADRDPCGLKRTYKSWLCATLMRSGQRRGSVEACVDDPAVQGRTVEAGG